MEWLHLQGDLAMSVSLEGHIPGLWEYSLTLSSPLEAL